LVSVTQWVRACGKMEACPGREPAACDGQHTSVPGMEPSSLHRDSSPTCPKPTGRTVGNPACKPGNGSAVPGGLSVQAALLSPEICELWLSRRFSVPGRQQSARPAVVARRYHRGQRTGHVRTGVARELGRASCLLRKTPAEEGYRLNKSPGVWRGFHPPGEPEAGNTNKGSTRGIGARATSEVLRDGQLAVLAEHSTDGRRNSRSGR
jgi:hypothetical protein